MGNQLKSDIVLRKQEAELENNYNKLDNMKGDILTVRRQVEISMDDTLKRTNKIFLLRVLFVYLLVMIIPIVLMKNNNISNMVGMASMSTITGIFVLSVLWNFYQHRNRNSLRSSLRQFTKPDIEKVLKEDPLTEKDKQALERSRQTPMNRLLDLLENCVSTAVKEQDFEEAKYCQDRLNNINKNIQDGNSLGGYLSDKDILDEVREI